LKKKKKNKKQTKNKKKNQKRKERIHLKHLGGQGGLDRKLGTKLISYKTTWLSFESFCAKIFGSPLPLHDKKTLKIFENLCLLLFGLRRPSPTLLKILLAPFFWIAGENPRT